MNGPDSRFDAVLDRIADIPGDAGDSARRTFETVTGEIVVDDAPMDRGDYPETTDGYRSYLHDCHEWAIEQYAQAASGLVHTTNRLGTMIERYPSFGSYDAAAVEARDDEERAAVAVAEEFKALKEARGRVKRIEVALEGEE